MRKPRDRGAARAITQSSRCEPPNGASAAIAVSAAATSPSATGVSLNDASSPSGPDAGLHALLVTLKRQNDVIAAIEEEGHRRPDETTDAGRDQERRLVQALGPRWETLGRIINTPASTPAGLCAKAEALRLVILDYAFLQGGETLDDVAHDGDPWDRLALSLACDVLAWGSAA